MAIMPFMQDHIMVTNWLVLAVIYFGHSKIVI